MADWLAYGLEDAYADQPDIGIVRKHKTVSGLIKYQPKGEPADWAAAAKQILATEKPDVVVVMLGLSDRIPIREPAGDKSDDKKKDAHGKPNDSNDTAAKPEDKDSELSPEDADNADAPPSIGPQKSTRSPNGIYEFREERWVELYNKKIDEMISVLKSRGVPVVWVGLPAIRGTKGTSDMLFLDSLYRDAAGRPGSPMSTSGTALSTRPAATCSRARISKARPAACVPMTAYSSPRPARASLRIMSSAR